jgi:hypothetical protein
LVNRSSSGAPPTAAVGAGQLLAELAFRGRARELLFLHLLLAAQSFQLFFKQGDLAIELSSRTVLSSTHAACSAPHDQLAQLALQRQRSLLRFFPPLSA